MQLHCTFTLEFEFQKSVAMMEPVPVGLLSAESVHKVVDMPVSKISAQNTAIRFVGISDNSG
jgi:hypothetical protein